MKLPLVAFTVGFIFAIGLGIAGMTQPQKVIGFLDVSHWNPALLFVMFGAVGVHAITYPLVRRRKSPLLSTEWHVPNARELSVKLILGSAIFGVGWGLGGFCPGPSIVSLASGDSRVMIFVSMMIVGMLIAVRLENILRRMR